MSKNILSNIAMFAVGAAAGSLVTWKLIVKKYEQLAQEEIESVRAVYYSTDSASESEESKEEDSDIDEEDEYDRIKEDYEDLLYAEGYVDEKIEKGEEDMLEPYVISPDEFDENGYDTESYYYYADGVVENSVTKEILDDETIEEWIGSDFMDHYGEFEEDSVFVRNDRMRTDFEILRVSETYSEDN